MKISVINGPNLNLLGRRKVEVYGTVTLTEIEARLRKVAEELGVEMDFFQSNCTLKATKKLIGFVPMVILGKTLLRTEQQVAIVLIVQTVVS